MNEKYEPAIISELYGRVDGRSAYKSNVARLSVGVLGCVDSSDADVCGGAAVEASFNDGREAQRIPLHRVLDMAIMVCWAKRYYKDAYRADKRKVDAERVGLQGDAMDLSFVSDDDGAKQRMEKLLRRDDELLSERLSVLAFMLKEMEY